MRKILREGKDLERIKKNEIEVPRMIPSIVKFIKEKYGNGVKVKTENKGVHFGNDDYSASCKVIKIYVEDMSLTAAEVKHQIWNDINNFFGIDLARYGSCLSLVVYRKMWIEI